MSSSALVTALILAGGKGTRLGGIAKHELVIDGETIFARQVRALAPRVAEVVVSSPREVPGHRTVRDAIDGVGPLAGIAAGLAACATPWLLVLAGDMPYVTGSLVDQLLAPLDESLDAVGIRIGSQPVPLACVLHVRVRPVVERRIAAGVLNATGPLTDEDLRVRWIEHVDAQALRNVNSPEDLRS